jgi:hypothetical protein
MTLDSLMFLLTNYWIYMAGALLVGLVAGWFSYSPRAR